MQLEQKSLEYYYETGWPDNIIETLNRSMGQYQRYYKYVKVGITSDPERRFGEHKRNRTYEWERMIVVYATKSVKHANIVEDWFIANREELLVNKYKGTSNMCNSDYYYAYFLLGNNLK